MCIHFVRQLIYAFLFLFLLRSLHFHRTSSRRVDVASLERCACWEIKKTTSQTTHDGIWRDQMQLLFSWPENWIVDKLLNALKRHFITIKLFPHRWCLFLSMHIAYINAKRSFTAQNWPISLFFLIKCTETFHCSTEVNGVRNHSICFCVSRSILSKQLKKLLLSSLPFSGNFSYNRKHIEKLQRRNRKSLTTLFMNKKMN